jgi:hypothetical protein
MIRFVLPQSHLDHHFFSEHFKKVFSSDLETSRSLNHVSFSDPKLGNGYTR